MHMLSERLLILVVFITSIGSSWKESLILVWFIFTCINSDVGRVLLFNYTSIFSYNQLWSRLNWWWSRNSCWREDRRFLFRTSSLSIVSSGQVLVLSRTPDKWVILLQLHSYYTFQRLIRISLFFNHILVLVSRTTLIKSDHIKLRSLSNRLFTRNRLKVSISAMHDRIQKFLSSFRKVSVRLLNLLIWRKACYWKRLIRAF